MFIYCICGLICQSVNAQDFFLSCRTSNIHRHHPHLLQKPSPHPPHTAAIQNHSIRPALHSESHLTSLSTSGYRKFHHNPLSLFHTPQCLLCPRQGSPTHSSLACLPATYLCSTSSCSSTNMLDSTTLLLEAQLQIKPSSRWCFLVVMDVPLYLVICFDLTVM